MMTGFGTPSEVIEVLQDIPGFSLSGWRVLDSSGRRICIIRYIARNSLKADCDINGHAKNYKLHIDIEVKCLVADATATAWILSGSGLTSDGHHVAANSIKQHLDSVPDS